MRKTLITGAYGLVGSAIREEIKQNSLFLTPQKSELDFLNKDAVFSFLSEFRPQQIIHCAARVGGLFGNMNFPATMMRENLLINLNLFDAAVAVGNVKILTYLSSCIFPNKASYPLQAQSLHDGPPHDSNFAYAHAKRILDIQARAYQREFGLQTSLAVLTNVYGPHDYFHLERSHVIPGLIHKAWLAKQTGESLVVAGSGKPLREFTFSRDIARLTLWGIEQPLFAEPLFFSSGYEYSIEEAVSLIVKAMDFRGKVIFDTSKPDGQMRKPTDSQTLKKMQPDFVFTSLEEGLHLTTEWFIRNYSHVRL